MLLEKVALCSNKGTGASKAGYLSIYGFIGSYQPERPLAHCQDARNTDRYDQPMGQGSRAFICQRAVGEYSLPDYGPVISVNRPVWTRMRGGVGRGS